MNKLALAVKTLLLAAFLAFLGGFLVGLLDH